MFQVYLSSGTSFYTGTDKATARNIFLRVVRAYQEDGRSQDIIFLTLNGILIDHECAS